MFINVVKRHESRDGEYNGWEALISIVIQVIVLTWGEFF